MVCMDIGTGRRYVAIAMAITAMTIVNLRFDVLDIGRCGRSYKQE